MLFDSTPNHYKTDKSYGFTFSNNPTNHKNFDWLIESWFMPLSTVFQSYYGDSSHYLYLSWVSPIQGWCSEVSCPRALICKSPQDPMRLEPRTPGLRVKHFTTEPCRTPIRIVGSMTHRKLTKSHSFNSCQPAQAAQVDMGWYLWNTNPPLHRAWFT